MKKKNLHSLVSVTFLLLLIPHLGACTTTSSGWAESSPKNAAKQQMASSDQVVYGDLEDGGEDSWSHAQSGHDALFPLANTSAGYRQNNESTSRKSQRR